MEKEEGNPLNRLKGFADYSGSKGGKLMQNVSNNRERIKTGDLSKLGSVLGNLVIALENGQNISNVGGVRIVNGKVLVDVVGTTADGLQQALEAKAVSDGVEVVSCLQHVCSIYCPVDKLTDVASLDIVKFMTPVMMFGN